MIDTFHILGALVVAFSLPILLAIDCIIDAFKGV
jgi:hypothetical protein